MTQARRAGGRSRRAWLLIVIPLLMLLAGLLLFRGLGQQAEQGGLSIPGASTTSSPASTDAATPTATPSPSRTPTPSPSKTSAKPNDAKATAALRACRTKVKAADEVLDVAKTGMRNWSDHVQAQTDANSGDITPAKMDDIFNRTMKAGDEDEERYRSAVKRYEGEKGSCREVAGASAQIRKQLTQCAQRG